MLLHSTTLAKRSSSLRMLRLKDWNPVLMMGVNSTPVGQGNTKGAIQFERRKTFNATGNRWVLAFESNFVPSE